MLLRFGHAENIIPLITSLNLFKDNLPLKSDNYKNQHHRLFKSGVIAPFSSNIALVLLKCNEKADFRVKLLINELPVGVINAGELECNHEIKNFSSHLKLKDSICNFETFKEKLTHTNEYCFKNENFCDISNYEKQEL